MRLDRFLTHVGLGTRKDVKLVIRTKRVKINEVIVTNDGAQVNTSIDQVKVDDEVKTYKEYRYYLLNKPVDYVCANEDKLSSTVIDLNPNFSTFNVHTVGRLDKDTTGALLLTNNGLLTHRLINPKFNVEKIYSVTVDRDLDNALVEQFLEGFLVNDEYKTLPSKLEITGTRQARLTLTEGKYHQVKRMFLHFGYKVLTLNRDQFHHLRVDDLKLGESRELTEHEEKSLFID
ncbi:MAG TPA: pseudouridine synthase [Bacilli bacterium]|nr:pseudouridine synthase [Bacilli bacterium]